jgi:hypothetical protein
MPTNEDLKLCQGSSTYFASLFALADPMSEPFFSVPQFFLLEPAPLILLSHIERPHQ